MKLFSRAVLVIGMTVGVVATAHAASFNCAYTLNDGRSGVYTIEADDGVDATNQALALINRDYPGSGFSLQCHAS
jgi:hypothetical protein